MKNTHEEHAKVEIFITSSTIFRMLLWAFAVWAAVTLWREISLCILALLFALAVDPLIQWLEGRGLARGPAVGVFGVAVAALVIAGTIAVVPPLMKQAGDVVEDYSRLEKKLQASLATTAHPLVQRAVAKLLSMPRSPDAAQLVRAPVEWGRFALVVAGSVFWVYALTLYFLIDGRLAYAWILAYLPRNERDKAAATIPETTAVVAAYVRGQLVTSALCGGYALAVLSFLGVPAAVPLAMLAALCDILPVIGFVMFSVPSVLVALSVSPATAAQVAGLFVLYHALEVYVIVPRIYGNSLRLSTLVVMLAVMVGAVLDGVLGAILILPLVAIYPIVERIWGSAYLPEDVVEDHASLAGVAPHQAEEAVQAVIEGQNPPVPTPAPEPAGG